MKQRKDLIYVSLWSFLTERGIRQLQAYSLTASSSRGRKHHRSQTRKEFMVRFGSCGHPGPAVGSTATHVSWTELGRVKKFRSYHQKEGQTLSRHEE